MDFLRDEIEGEESVDNINLKLQNNLKKRKKSRDPEEETKAELWQSALNALKASESQLNMCSHVMDPDQQWLLTAEIPDSTTKVPSKVKDTNPFARVGIFKYF